MSQPVQTTCKGFGYELESYSHWRAKIYYFHLNRSKEMELDFLRLSAYLPKKDIAR